MYINCTLNDRNIIIIHKCNLKINNRTALVQYISSSRRAMPFLRLLFTGISPRRRAFDPSLFHFTFVVDKVTPGQNSLSADQTPLSVSFHQSSVLIIDPYTADTIRPQ